MKKLKILFIFAITLSFAVGCKSNSSKDTNDDTTDYSMTDSTGMDNGLKYGIKSGIITYEVSGEDKKVSTLNKVIFDENGTKEAFEYYENNQLTSRTINKNDGFIYSMDFTTKICTKTKSFGEPGIAEKFDISDTKWSDFEKQQYSFKKLPDITVLGKKCQVYSTYFVEINKKFAGWKGILLSKESNWIGGDNEPVVVNMKAVKFEENVEIPADIWEIPKDFTIKEE